MDAQRLLVIVADDFGLDPETNRGILDLASKGKVTGASLLVNAPCAREAVRDWHRAGGTRCVDLGWHACLTLDRPLLSRHRVPSLVRDDGSFLSLGEWILRWMLGRIRLAEVRAELQAQYDWFTQLTGMPPTLVNGHHHIQLLPGVGTILLDLLSEQEPRPYVRRVREPLHLLAEIPTARCKRAILGTLGLRFAEKQMRRGFPGNDCLVGLTDGFGLIHQKRGQPINLMEDWLTQAPGQIVEWICHPGYADHSAVTRDHLLRLPQTLQWLADWLNRRQTGLRKGEMDVLQQSPVAGLCKLAGLHLCRPSHITGSTQPQLRLVA